METPASRDNAQSPGAPVLLISLGEASALTLGEGYGISESKRYLYN